LIMFFFCFFRFFIFGWGKGERPFSTFFVIFRVVTVFE